MVARIKNFTFKKLRKDPANEPKVGTGVKTSVTWDGVLGAYGRLHPAFVTYLSYLMIAGGLVVVTGSAPSKIDSNDRKNAKQNPKARTEVAANAAVGATSIAGRGLVRVAGRGASATDTVPAADNGAAAPLYENLKDVSRDWGKFADVRRGKHQGWGHYLAMRARAGGKAGEHKGIDLTYAVGATVIAETDGEYVGTMNGNSKIPGRDMVVFKMADGNFAHYLYVAGKAGLKKGHKVKKGDVIGTLNSKFYDYYSKDVPPHIHFGVKSGSLLSSKSIDPSPYITANRPSLEHEFYYSTKYRFIMRYLWDRAALGLIAKVTDQKTYDIDHKLIKEALAAYDRSTGRAPAKNLEIKPGFVNPNGSFESFTTQMQALEPSIMTFVIYLEEFSEAGFNDAGTGTFLSGVKFLYKDKTSGQAETIAVGGTISGIKKDGKISAAEKELNRKYVINHMYNVAYKEIYDKIDVPLSYEWMIALCDLVYNVGYIPNSISSFLNKGQEDKAVSKLLQYNKTTKKRKKVLSPSLAKRRGIEVALVKGDIKVSDFLKMETGSYNSVDLDGGGFNKRGKYVYDQNFYHDINTFVASKDAKVDKYKNETIILTGVSKVLPDDVLRQLREMSDGLPELAVETIEALAEETVVVKEVEEVPAIVKIDDKIIAKASKSSAKAMSSYQSFKKFYANKDHNMWPSVIDNAILNRRLEKTREEAEKALVLNPRDWNAKALMIPVLYYDANRTKDAAQRNINMEKVIRLARDVLNKSDIDDNSLLADILIYAARAYEEQGFYYRAYTNYVFAARRMGDDSLWPKVLEMQVKAIQRPAQLSEAEALFRSGKTNVALDKIQGFLYSPDLEKYMPQHKIDAYVLLADIYMKQRKWIDAADNYKFAFEESLNPDYAMIAAELYYNIQDYEKSAAIIRNVCLGDYYKDNPNKKANAWYLAGSVREAMKQYKPAVINYKNANKLLNIFQSDIDRVQELIESREADAVPKKTSVTGTQKPSGGASAAGARSVKDRGPSQKVRTGDAALAKAVSAELIAAVKKFIDAKQYQAVVEATARIKNPILDNGQQAELWYYRGVALESLGNKTRDKGLLKQADTCYGMALKLNPVMKKATLARSKLKVKMIADAAPHRAGTFDATSLFLGNEFDA